MDDAAMLEGRLPDRGVRTSVPILLATSWAYADSMNFDCWVDRRYGFWDGKPLATSICVVAQDGPPPVLVATYSAKSIREPSLMNFLGQPTSTALALVCTCMKMSWKAMNSLSCPTS